MFHCFVLVETNYYRCTGDCQCMVYAQAHLQAILLPRSIFSSNLHCSADGKLTIQDYFLYSSKYFYFSLPIHQLSENRPPTHMLLFIKDSLKYPVLHKENFKFEMKSVDLQLHHRMTSASLTNCSQSHILTF